MAQFDGGREPVDPETLPRVLQFTKLLWALDLERTSKRMRGDLDVTGPQRLVLRVVASTLECRREIWLLHVHPSTLTGIIQRLVAQRLLIRTRDPRDRCRAVLRLTARGSRGRQSTRQRCRA